DLLRLVHLLEVRSLGRLLSASSSLRRRFQAPVDALRREETEPGCGALEALELELALADLGQVLEDSRKVTCNTELDPASGWTKAVQNLQSLEGTMQTEMRYVYGPDWE
ncbi:unnamed protein product, partial [Polarella glacialis]